MTGVLPNAQNQLQAKNYANINAQETQAFIKKDANSKFFLNQPLDLNALALNDYITKTQTYEDMVDATTIQSILSNISKDLDTTFTGIIANQQDNINTYLAKLCDAGVVVAYYDYQVVNGDWYKPAEKVYVEQVKNLIFTSIVQLVNTQKTVGNSDIALIAGILQASFDKLKGYKDKQIEQMYFLFTKKTPAAKAKLFSPQVSVSVDMSNMENMMAQLIALQQKPAAQ